MKEKTFKNRLYAKQRALGLCGYSSCQEPSTQAYCPKHKKQVRACTARWKKEHPENRRKYQLREKYGIGVNVYEALFKAQDGCCAICQHPERTELNRRLSVDHSHRTKIVRGLLCTKCNRGLGMFEDSIPRLQAAVDYLKAERKSTYA